MEAALAFALAATDDETGQLVGEEALQKLKTIKWPLLTNEINLSEVSIPQNDTQRHCRKL